MNLALFIEHAQIFMIVMVVVFLTTAFFAKKRGDDDIKRIFNLCAMVTTIEILVSCVL